MIADEIIVGITMSLDDYDFIRPGIDYNYIRREYGQMVRQAGGQPLFLDPSIDPEAAARLCDGIVISGGEDIEPDFYEQEDRSGKRKEPRLRTDWERLLIDACDANNKPIFGVCYGCQLLNVHFGGSLYQDIHDELGSEYYHGTSAAPAIHTVAFSHEFMGFGRGETAEVISRHHQAVKDIAPGFVVAGSSPDGVAEAIMNDDHTGVQWHPESDETGEKLYRAFVAKCAARKATHRATADAEVYREQRSVAPYV